jgi:hypothetical protein
MTQGGEAFDASFAKSSRRALAVWKKAGETSIMSARSASFSLVVLTLVIAACGGSSSSSPSGVGTACSATSPCAAGQRCLTEEPGGLCVSDCSSSGERDTCPSDGYCDRDTFSVNGVETKLTLCLQSCTKDEECRAEYRCSGASAGTGKVCRRR